MGRKQLTSDAGEIPKITQTMNILVCPKLSESTWVQFYIGFYINNWKSNLILLRFSKYLFISLEIQLLISIANYKPRILKN